MPVKHRTRRILLVVFILALATFSAAGAARAGEARRDAPVTTAFGERGQIAIGNIIGFTTQGGYLGPNMICGVPHGDSWAATGAAGVFGINSWSARGTALVGPSTYADSSDTVWISPSVDVFVTERVSIGGTLGLSYTADTDRSVDAAGRETTLEGRATTLSAVPRVGYAIALGEPLTLWPRAGFGYSSTSAHASWPDAERRSLDAWIGVVDLGIIYRPSQHIYLHVAPELVTRSLHVHGDGASIQDGVSVDLGVTAGVGILLSS